jgi:hypothetical protein
MPQTFRSSRPSIGGSCDGDGDGDDGDGDGDGGDGDRGG